MSHQLHKSLRLDLNNRLVELPLWAQFFVRLGGSLAREEAFHSRLIIAASVPQRGFAACFATLGVVTAGAARKANDADSASHFSRLCKLPEGAAVTVERDFRKHAGRVIGTSVVRGETYLRVQLSGEAMLIPERDADRVLRGAERAPVGVATLAAPGSAKRAFVRHAVGRDAAKEMWRNDHLDCVVVGRKSVLAQESCDGALAIISDSGADYRGRIAELICSRQLLPSDRPRRSEFISEANAAKSTALNGGVPRVAIFDGAAPYLKWRHLFTASHQLIILDRSLPRYEEAVPVLNDRFDSRGEKVPDAFAMPPIPTTIELFGFREVK